MSVQQETDTTVGLDEGDVGSGKIQLLAKDDTTLDVDKRSAFISQLIKTSLGKPCINALLLSSISCHILSYLTNTCNIISIHAISYVYDMYMLHTDDVDLF